MEKNPWIGLILIVAVVAVIVAYSVWQGSTNSTPSATSTPAASATIMPTTMDRYSQHSSDYIYSYLSALSALYQSTQTFSSAQALFGNTGQPASDTVILTSLGETISDLRDAQSLISSYSNDSDQEIGVTAALLDVDITTELNTVMQVKSSYAYAIQNQDVSALRTFQTQLADFATAKNTLEKDLSKGMQIVKYIIERPTNDPHPTGPVDFVISPENRAYLAQQIGILFPKPLDHAAGQSNVYLLFARVSFVLLSVDTYEQRRIVQI